MENEKQITFPKVVELLEEMKKCKNLTKTQKKNLNDIVEYLFMYECPSCHCLLGYSSNKELWQERFISKWCTELENKVQMPELKFAPIPKLSISTSLEQSEESSDDHLDLLFDSSKSIQERIDEHDK